MEAEVEEKAELSENISEVIEKLKVELKELYTYRNLFFENHPLEMASEKNKCVDQRKEILVEKFENIDETQIPFDLKAQFLYMKGRCYNASSTYDSRATQCLSKAVKLNPHLVAAWNELGECYLKNLNIKEAKDSFEGALKHERNQLSLRSLSIILRHELGSQKESETISTILKSVDLAKEAVTQDFNDGVSWTILGNAYLCQFFLVAQDPVTLKLCMSAYKKAWRDPVAKGQPDLFYNKGVALKYEECYSEALEMFYHSCRLDPDWAPAREERIDLSKYLTEATKLVQTRGKLKGKRLSNMIKSLDINMLGDYSPGTFHTFGTRKDILLEHVFIDQLQEGNNHGKVVMGKVIGSILNDNGVPFTFALIDASMSCVCVTVYNWGGSRGAIIGDTVAIPEPSLRNNVQDNEMAKFDFKSIRVNNPLLLVVNGKRVGSNQVATTHVTSRYEMR